MLLGIDITGSSSRLMLSAQRRGGFGGGQRTGGLD